MLYRGEMWDFPFAVIRCGPGKVAAAAAAQAAVQYLNPALLLSFGTAGCPDPKVAVGTLAVATSVIDVALTVLEELPVKIPDRFEPDPALNASLVNVPGTRTASLLCWEGHLTSPLQRLPVEVPEERLVVVDWESAAVAQVAQMWEIPWAALKVVSDHGEAERLRLLAVVARRPLQWGAEVFRRACDVYAQSRNAGGRARIEEETEG
jgi:adenosylhomocysteine nucleosidase